MDPVDPNLQLMWNGEIPWTIDPSSPFFCLPWFYSGSLLVNTTHQIRYCICNGQACDGILRKRCSTGPCINYMEVNRSCGAKTQEVNWAVNCLLVSFAWWGRSILSKRTGRALWSSCNKGFHNVLPRKVCCTNPLKMSWLLLWCLFIIYHIHGIHWYESWNQQPPVSF